MHLGLVVRRCLGNNTHCRARHTKGVPLIFAAFIILAKSSRRTHKKLEVLMLVSHLPSRNRCPNVVAFQCSCYGCAFNSVAAAATAAAPLSFVLRKDLCQLETLKSTFVARRQSSFLVLFNLFYLLLHILRKRIYLWQR